MKEKLAFKLLMLLALIVYAKYYLGDYFSLSAGVFFQYYNRLETAQLWLKKINDSANSNKSVIVIDLSSPLEPKSLYEPIKCRKSAYFIVRTTLCVHDLDKDIHVSGSIWRDGVWEPHALSNCIVRTFLLLKFK